MVKLTLIMAMIVGAGNAYDVDEGFDDEVGAGVAARKDTRDDFDRD